ncbi:NASP-related protein sim3 [Candida viswanathii]|uniref:NASP-related protein sim3 n=1 Tax=Candida viswanathii TaxID=5486 RepID=A0A367XPX8_9ASCO|nr:NASP-related protein sim3 [Candida viswanathii]
MSTYSPEITKLISDGSRAYSAKDFDLACEKYGEACEKYAEAHDGNEDGDLLLLYGKAVFQSGVSKSEVFGGNPDTAEAKKEEEEEEDGKGDDGKEEGEKEDDDKFQFYADGDEEEQQEEEGAPQSAEGEGQGEGDDEGVAQSDFEIAWELLDLARSLFENQVKSLDKGDLTTPYLSNDTEETDNEYVTTVRKLSETYDILGEVSLEAENFNQAAEDLGKSLELRLELYPDTSSLITEAHYKLALALEFQSDDAALRKKAAEQMKLAVESLERRNAAETEEAKKKDNQEMIDEMKEKYKDLLKDPSEEIKNQQLDIIKGILGEEAPSSSNSSGSGENVGAAIVNNLQSMVKKKSDKPTVNDLSGSVRKRKKPDAKDSNVKKPKK